MGKSRYFCYSFFVLIVFSLEIHSDEKLLVTEGINDNAKPKKQSTTRARKDWNFLVYLAANNNLHTFAIDNLHQMINMGSNKNINIIVQLDEYGGKQINRYYIEKGNTITACTFGHSVETISGTPESLYEFIKWSVQNFPANHNAVVLWNHGSGVKDPSRWKRVLMSHRDDLSAFNPQTGLLEISKTSKKEDVSKTHTEVYYLEIVKEDLKEKGIAFNDAYGTFLSNQDLKNVFDAVSTNVLGGRKIDLACMDACHMAMAEVGSQVKDSVCYMTGSEEIEPGAGYNYSYVLEPFMNRTLTPRELAQHIVNSYERHYRNRYAEYTQSAIDLQHLGLIENNLRLMGMYLTSLVCNKESSEFAKLLKLA